MVWMWAVRASLQIKGVMDSSYSMNFQFSPSFTLRHLHNLSKFWVLSLYDQYLYCLVPSCVHHNMTLGQVLYLDLSRWKYGVDKRYCTSS